MKKGSTMAERMKMKKGLGGGVEGRRWSEDLSYFILDF